ncbi:HCLS1 protein, partial [Rhinopomastus cyanomelas]|nr:HCLS1 protein [Rhinopomastus cyanomelas]
MWKAVVGHDVSVKVEAQGDDWDTDPDFVNDLSEKEQRWGAKTVEGSGRAEHFNIHQLRSKVSEEHEVIKQKELESGPKASYGYGGKFGTERDRMDKCAVGHEYVADVGKHSSQTDAAQGFGGKYGVQRDRADKSALGFEYKGEVEKHASQKGKFVNMDYSKGFGGRYGVEKDKVDRAAVGFDYRSPAEKHDSQRDHAKGFGGRYGVQKDRVDKSAAAFDEVAAPTPSYESTRPLEAGAASSTSRLRARFEDMARPAAEEERARRHAGRKVSRGRVAVFSETLPQSPQPRAAFLGRRGGRGSCVPGAAPPWQSCLRWGLCKRLSCHLLTSSQEARREDEETPPTLPPRPADLSRDFCKVPSQDQPIYSDTMDVGGDYEELPESPDCCVGASGDADYEEVPAPCEEPGDDIYDDGADGGEADNIYEVDSLGTCAVALYDYQGEGEDEISFDPDDTVTHIEMVDEGWWRGQCRGKTGLFPANYVKLLQ